VNAPTFERCRVALFDMDRTLVRTDTATLYVRYQRRIGEASTLDVARVAWWMLQYTLGILDAEGVAEAVARGYAGRSESEMLERCRAWFRSDVLPHVTTAARRAVDEHRRAGRLTAIVTGTTRYAAEPLAAELGIDHVVCSRLEVEGDAFTGRVVKPMCFGPGKITLAEALGREHGFGLDEATFYSDSITDRPLLERVRAPVVVNPDARLRRLATRRGWPIEAW
jgi:HAD superfamily hydrolase (TIGR01490 family)